jgi:ATP-dependent phosphofructokinase / diphosphate-dependent phosphofructokinase
VAARLADEGVQVVGVPKTIDNDLSATELTFGFDTAVQVCVDAIDRLHTTAESHDRVMVVEVMGRHAGHIATWAAIAGGATMVLVPEHPFDVDEVSRAIQHRHNERGRFASIVVVAEGAVPAEGTMSVTSGEADAFGHVRLGGIGEQLARAIEERTGYETRAIVLGHVQRGGTPTAFDRVLATRFGIAAIDAVHDGAFGSMVALRAGDIVRVPLAEATRELKLVDPAVYDVASIFFG